jgi:hydroxymethylpyrimidine pyrophosphatase-like HAD family hydrolase
VRYQALAADYDGTLAHHGLIDDLTWSSLKQLRDSGRKLIMVTGRELDELLGLLPHPEMFDRIVAENGAVLYCPANKQVKLLAEPPPPEFGDELKRRGAERVAVGRVIVATWEPHQDTVLKVIHDMALELQVIFNKGAVMILPTGVNKATGLDAALKDLGLSPHNVVAVGDAENDQALLRRAELGVAVANALP